MSELTIKAGDQLTVDEDIVIRIDRICGGCAYLTVDPLDDISVSQGKIKPFPEDVQGYLGDVTNEILSAFSEMDAAASQETLSKFVSDLFYAIALKRQQEERRHRQAEGIAKAKARGVRFGPAAKPLPDRFDEIHRAWRGGELTLRQAADACGIPQSSFYDKAVRKERAANESA